ncbi:hypothetical protein ACMD2_03973 [Ananas comosus]|uniref:Uncharacterized protein n=1 Tax=Ananas comosus TaxID=4615 RepID=A0A199UGU3_ANACO|nr:hypothetical protein ACMD2_03973 [Ananas comosus]
METFRHQRSPGSDRFLGLFSPAPVASGGGGGGGVAGDELHEDEVFWTTPAPDPPTEPSRSTKPSPATANRVPNPSPATAAFGGAAGGGGGAVLRRVPDRSFGILAALAEDDRKRAAVTASSSAPFVHRKATFAAAPSASASASASASTSPSSSAWAIPAVPKPKSEFSRSATAGSKIYQQSAPVKVPVRPTRPRKGSGELAVDDDDDEGYRGEAEMLPPHEIVARAWGDGTPMMTSSVLEGVGRTLKGRDLRRVRNAVLRQTGFLDNV